MTTSEKKELTIEIRQTQEHLEDMRKSYKGCGYLHGERVTALGIRDMERELAALGKKREAGNKRCVVCFSNGQNIQFDGHKTESQIKRIEDMATFRGFGLVRDYINGFVGEWVSCVIHGKFQNGQVSK